MKTCVSTYSFGPYIKSADFGIFGAIDFAAENDFDGIEIVDGMHENCSDLELAKKGIVDTLIFSKDDCAQYGLNVLEANELQMIIEKNNLAACVKTGADEIPISLLAKIISM